MKNATISMITVAAVAGLLGGAASVRAEAVAPTATPSAVSADMLAGQRTATRTLSDLAGVKAQDMDTTAGKHDCKGENSCKGQGGCKSSDNGCKAKNSCKGKGGCNTSGGGI